MHIGFHPPERRWVSNAHYDYGEGAFTYGWYKTDEHITGKWIRQVLFVKGTQPKKTGYHIVIDTVDPTDDKERTWRHPWQLNPDAIEIRDDQSVVTSTTGATMQIIPVDPDRSMTAHIIQGQESPKLLGWRVYGANAKPWPVPTYEWQAKGTFSRAWIIQMQEKEADWPVASVKVLPTENPGEIRFAVHRKKGGVDHVIRRFPGTEKTTFKTEIIAGDVAVISYDAKHEILSTLELTQGDESVAAP
jgi:hypothetical protein